MQSWPKWAQRHVVLGLDLQGGSHILLEVDTKAVRKEKLEALRDDVRRVLRDARVGYTGLVVRGNSVEVRMREGQSSRAALAKLRELSQPLGGFLGATGQRTLDVSNDGNLIRLTVTDPAIVERVRQAVEQSIQIIERRINELGTVEPLIQREGHRPHPGAGARPAGPDAAEGAARQDRQARFPHGRRQTSTAEQALQGRRAAGRRNALRHRR